MNPTDPSQYPTLYPAVSQNPTMDQPMPIYQVSNQGGVSPTAANHARHNHYGNINHSPQSSSENQNLSPQQQRDPNRGQGASYCLNPPPVEGLRTSANCNSPMSGVLVLTTPPSAQFQTYMIQVQYYHTWCIPLIYCPPGVI